jgi:hypothetical protein
MRSVFVCLAAASLTGCVTEPTFHHWYKPGLAEHRQDFNYDWYQCVKENISDAMAVQCMKAQGYALAWSDNSGEDGLPRDSVTVPR